jgi:hypothetical protein
MRADELAIGAPDPADAARRAERFLDAAAQTGLDLGQLNDDAWRILAIASVPGDSASARSSPLVEGRDRPVFCVGKNRAKSSTPSSFAG